VPIPEHVTVIVAVFLLAGWVKGVVGMGLPTVAMGALGLLVQPVQAAALLVIPSLVTNVWQFSVGPSKLVIARRLASMMVFVCVGTGLGIQFLTYGSSNWPTVALGMVLAAYAALALFLPKLIIPFRSERHLSPVVGGLTGLLSGATGVFAVPAVPYLGSLDLSKDELLQALGLSFTVSTVALAVALGSSGSYSRNILVTSLVAVVPALLGMFIGQRTRDWIEPVLFRKCFFSVLLLDGCYMMLHALFI